MVAEEAKTFFFPFDNDFIFYKFCVLVISPYWCSFQIQERIRFSLGRDKGTLLYMQHHESDTVISRRRLNL
jgi:hypothetical protein